MQKLGLFLTASVLSLQASEGWGFAGMKPGEAYMAWAQSGPMTTQEKKAFKGAFDQATKDGRSLIGTQRVTLGTQAGDQAVAQLRAATGVGGGGAGVGSGGAGHTPNPYAEAAGVPGMFERADAEYAKAEAGRVLEPVFAAMQEEQNRYDAVPAHALNFATGTDETLSNNPAIHARTVLEGVGPEQLLDILAAARLKAEEVPDSPELAAVLHAAHNHLQHSVDQEIEPLLEQMDNLSALEEMATGDVSGGSAEHAKRALTDHKVQDLEGTLAALRIQGQLREYTPVERALLDIAAEKQLNNAYDAHVQPLVEALVEVMQAEENRYIFSELPGMADEDRIDYTDVVNSPADHARNILANKTEEALAALHNTLVTGLNRGHKLTDMEQALLSGAAERLQDEIFARAGAHADEVVKRQLFNSARGTMDELLEELELARNFAALKGENFNEAQMAKMLVETSRVAALATLLDAHRRGAFGTDEPHVQTLLNVAQQQVNAHATLAPLLVEMNEFANLAQQGGGAVNTPAEHAYNALRDQTLDQLEAIVQAASFRSEGARTEPEWALLEAAEKRIQAAKQHKKKRTTSQAKKAQKSMTFSRLPLSPGHPRYQAPASPSSTEKPDADFAAQLQKDLGVQADKVGSARHLRKSVTKQEGGQLPTQKTGWDEVDLSESGAEAARMLAADGKSRFSTIPGEEEETAAALTQQNDPDTLNLRPGWPSGFWGQGRQQPPKGDGAEQDSHTGPTSKKERGRRHKT